MRDTALWIGIVLAMSASSAFAQASVATADGLSLKFADKGDITGVDLDGRLMPGGEIIGGFHVSEVTREGEELIANGSLEQDTDGNGVPDGFYSEGVWKRDSTVARTGKWSMRAEVPGKEDGLSGSFGITAPAEGGATYLVSFWLKSKGLGGRYAATTGYVQEQNEKGEYTTKVFQHMMSGSVSRDQDWTRISLVLTTEGDTRKLNFRTNIYYGYGILWADDFSLKKVSGSAQYVPTRAVRDGDGIKLTGVDPRLELEIEAIFKPDGDMLRLEGQVRSTAKRDRCIRLSYRLPLAAKDGTWWSDIGTAKQIKPGGWYSRTAPFGAFGPYSIYPFSSVVTADKTAGITLGVPMHPARPFRLGYATDQGLVVEWDFGLSSLPTRFPNSADFCAVFYRHDPKWGFRAAADKYYRLFPEYFKVRVKRFGIWYICDLSRLKNPEDFGLAFNEHVTEESVAADHKFGTIAFGYTEPWGWWSWAIGLRPKEDDPSPTYDEMIEILKAKAGDKELSDDDGRNTRRAAHTILNSGIYDEKGKFLLRSGYVARWGGYNWCLNPSPYAVEDGKFSRFQATYEWEIDKKLGYGADGIYLDSVYNRWSTMPNYRREHLERSRHPLTFTPLNAIPAQLGVWNQYEFAEYVSSDLHGRGKLLMANIFPYNWVFFNHLLDVMGHETGSANSLEQMRAERTLAYHKPYTWLMTKGKTGAIEVGERAMQAAMLYGIAPTLMGGSPDPDVCDRWRPVYKKYIPIIIALCEAGWEPLTHAEVEPAEILVERFGPHEGKLYLTARNTGKQAVAATFTVDIAALKIDPPTKVIRLPGGREISIKRGRFQDTIESAVTCAYQVLP